MTLIQTMITDDLIVQVADRRLTTGATGEVADDEFTKTVCWDFNFAIGFTGISRIDRWCKQSTSEWIATTICDYGVFEDGVMALKDAASKRVSTLPQAWTDRRLGIVVAGFDGRAEPLVAEVANFESGGPMPTDPAKFNLKSISRQPGRSTAYWLTGATLTEKWQHQLLLQRVPRALAKPKPDGITYAVKLMVQAQRSIAKTNTAVGTDAMAVTIPRTTFGEQMLRKLNGSVLMTNLDGTNTIGASKGPEFAYFDTHGFKFRQLGPHTAGNGVAAADLLGTAEPDNPDNQVMGFRILKWPKPPKQQTTKN